MNEVRIPQVTAPVPSNSASSKGAGETAVNTNGKNLPIDAEKAEKVEQPQAEKRPKQDLEVAVANVKDYVQNLQRDLQFSVDEELDQTVIKVVDSDSGELIRQIPEDIFLELARRLKDDGEFRLLNALG